MRKLSNARILAGLVTTVLIAVISVHDSVAKTHTDSALTTSGLVSSAIVAPGGRCVVIDSTLGAAVAAEDNPNQTLDTLSYADPSNPKPLKLHVIKEKPAPPGGVESLVVAPPDGGWRKGKAVSSNGELQKTQTREVACDAPIEPTPTRVTPVPTQSPSIDPPVDPPIKVFRCLKGLFEKVSAKFAS